MSDDERAIRDLVERWMRANRAGDAATVLGLMDDDVVVFMVSRWARHSSRLRHSPSATRP